MLQHGDGDELLPFPPSINPHYSTQDLPKTPAAQIPSNTSVENLGSGCRFYDHFDDLSCVGLASPQIDFSEIDDYFSAPADALEDGDADMFGEEEKDADLRPFGSCKSDIFGNGREAAPVVESPPPDDGRPSCRDADVPEVNEAATQPGPLPVPVPVPVAVGGGDACATSNSVKEEAQFSAFDSAILQDLSLHRKSQVFFRPGLAAAREAFRKAVMRQASLVLLVSGDNSTLKPWSMVPFSGPASKDRKGGWKEKSMTGMRAVADPSSPQPPAPGQEQPPPYVGLKKTLELDDDGNGNKWHAHEYTPLLPSDDGSNNLIPAKMSLRIEFKEEEPAPAFSLPSKRSRSGAPKDGPKTKTAPNKKSTVWEHMTKVVQVKVGSTGNTDGGGTQSKNNPCYKLMFAICHHCDKVFNAEYERHGTNNLRKHLISCSCNCTHSHSR